MKRKATISAISMMCAVMLMLSVPCQALLAWNNTGGCDPTFEIIGNTAYWSISLVTFDSTDSVRASVYLYQISSNGRETLIDSWTLLDGTGGLSESGSHSSLGAGTYLLRMHIYIDGAAGEDFISLEDTRTKS